MKNIATKGTNYWKENKIQEMYQLITDEKINVIRITYNFGFF